jgi:release factor glutamine methyltransferase
VRIITFPGVVEPHSGTWLLVEALRDLTLTARARVLDLCSGSGVLAIGAARRHCDVTAVDRSRRAVWSTRVNARRNGVRVRARRSDLFERLDGRRFDVIVANPPYVAAPGGERALLDRVCAQAADHLRPGGILLLAHSAVCDGARTLDALRAGGLDAEFVHHLRDPLGSLVIRGRAPGHGSASPQNRMAASA